MIEFKQKSYSEYDAMRYFYKELQRNWDRSRVELINPSQLIPVLKGNSVVIEKFVINHTLFGKDNYRMYLKIGAKAKMPEAVRLPGKTYQKRLGNLSLEFKGGMPGFKTTAPQEQRNNSDISGDTRLKLFGKGGGNDSFMPFGAKFNPYIDIEKTVQELLGDAVMYDKATRSLVLEFNSVFDAIKALDILPFGLNYKLYLLDT